MTSHKRKISSFILGQVLFILYVLSFLSLLAQNKEPSKNRALEKFISSQSGTSYYSIFIGNQKIGYSVSSFSEQVIHKKKMYVEKSSFVFQVPALKKNSFEEGSMYFSNSPYELFRKTKITSEYTLSLKKLDKANTYRYRRLGGKQKKLENVKVFSQPFTLLDSFIFPFDRKLKVGDTFPTSDLDFSEKDGEPVLSKSQARVKKITQTNLKGVPTTLYEISMRISDVPTSMVFSSDGTTLKMLKIEAGPIKFILDAKESAVKESFFSLYQFATDLWGKSFFLANLPSTKPNGIDSLEMDITNIPIAFKDRMVQEFRRHPYIQVLESPQQGTIRVLMHTLSKDRQFFLVNGNAVRRFSHFLKEGIVQKEKDLKPYLQETKEYDFSNPAVEKIVSLIEKKKTEKSSAMDKINSILDWLAKTMEPDETYVGIPEKASEIARNPKGVCAQYAVLFIALSRSMGIPAREVDGLASGGDKTLGPHAWVEVYLDNVGWIPVDPTFSDFPADPIHILFSPSLMKDLGRDKLFYDTSKPIQVTFQKVTLFKSMMLQIQGTEHK